MGLQAFYIDLLGLGGIHVEHARYTHLRRIRPDPRSLGVSSRRRNFNCRNGYTNNHSCIICLLRLQGEKMAIELILCLRAKKLADNGHTRKIGLVKMLSFCALAKAAAKQYS